jgi:hypothetical protein
MKNSGNFSDKIAKDPLGAATLASFFEASGQDIDISKGVKYEAKIVEDDESDSEDEREHSSEKVKTKTV